MRTSEPFLRPLFLARPTLIEDTVENDLESPNAGEITAQMLETLLTPTAGAEALLARALIHLQRGLRLDFAAVYHVTPLQPERLTLLAAEGLPPQFADAVRTLALWDFNEIADLPYNGDRPPCYGDFFSPIAARYGMRSGLVAALPHPQTGDVIGALLLGSRSLERFHASEAGQILSVARRLGSLLAACSPPLLLAA